MKSSITAGLNGDALKEMESNFRASALIRERLSALCNDKIESRRKEMRNASTYEDASWSHRAADCLGYERALFEVISLLSSK